MRFSVLFLFASSMVVALQGQSVSVKVALNACAYLDSIDNYDQLQDSIKGSLIAGMGKVMMEGSLEERKQIGTVEGIRDVMKEAFTALPSYCYNVRKLVIEHQKKDFYRMSANRLANDHYDEGNLFLESGNYKKAIDEFKASIKLDDTFIYAIDNLAIAYRRLNDFKTAIKYYKQSLQIFPEGDVALLNIAVSYSLLQDDVNSLKYYRQLKYFYPTNPEGYFGSAKILFLNADYENALDDLFSAHRRYVEVNSEYVKDSERLIGAMFSKLKEINRVDLFEKKAKQHNIDIDEH